MWESILTALGICVALSGPFIAHKMFPATAKAKSKSIEAYVPDHIDRWGNIVMRKSK